eukprot:CAMPEP_0113935416 /NCGR_PEP_ID=MMETSP1339-20121228/2567_1 /TAXON_ID=94617 /ORGANISM="Fibrocapsa japonica" /LENGTH=304 /DNA_ID=CAMNT_0000937563 /DNA_START=183 /DNA_END=1097 /DNA_ORIENTATION=+ /assembly_acc=CAM_ASM_000762
MATGNRYMSKCDDDDIFALSKTLSNDLRTAIRALGSFPVLSDSWNGMADTFGRIANISDMESKLPKDSENATLWECEELALRYLLEDGKLNLCLRNLVEFKNFERELRNAPATLPTDHRDKLDAFEKGLGCVLRNAWRHVEAIQTTDLPLLINYIGDVMEDAVRNPTRLESFQKAGELEKRQEVVVIYYLASLMTQVDEVSEDRVMPLIKERRLFSLLVSVMHAHHAKLNEGDLLTALTALSLICDTEDFSTYKDTEYLEETEEKEMLSSLHTDVIEDLTEDWDTRRKIRPLLDYIREVQRCLK